MVALAFAAANAQQRIAGGVLDAFGHHLQAQLVPQPHDRLGNPRALRTSSGLAHEAAVELESAGGSSIYCYRKPCDKHSVTDSFRIEAAPRVAMRFFRNGKQLFAASLLNFCAGPMLATF
ncbi:hypothetical protein [Acidovorax sp. NCPPB 3576]|uniref:hypothetical protein n=1 Tax=Acidovorax sp. NCPPB 3576 TaxID=2940488 RepID=UPI00234A0F55|nr:hypothetical protein [Acidovorax sp. NCPPB 3576]WCM86425.1 hypothetical protein M5C98_13590 [Acidovorax sp. NCPPB 3576]